MCTVHIKFYKMMTLQKNSAEFDCAIRRTTLFLIFTIQFVLLQHFFNSICRVSSVSFLLAVVSVSMETVLKRAAVTENLLLIDGVGFYNFHNNNKSFVLFCVYPTRKIPRLFKISAYSLYCPTCPQLKQILAVKYSFIHSEIGFCGGTSGISNRWSRGGGAFGLFIFPS